MIIATSMIMNALKCRTLCVYNMCVCNPGELKLVALYTAIALTEAVSMLVLTHAVTSGALMYIEQEN